MARAARPLACFPSVGSFNPKEWFALHYSFLVEIALFGQLIGSARTLALQYNPSPAASLGVADTQ
jgi:hypothetical protein